jgi:hypothetical protein
MATSALPAFTQAVITALQGASSLTGVRIFDGIEIDNSYPGDAIAIGHDGNSESDEVNAGSIRQEYKQLGAISKFEEGQINCWLWSFNGASDLTSRRVAAFNLLAAVENVVRSDVSFGGVVMYSAMETGNVSYRQTVQGAGVAVSFTLTYKAKI